MKFAVGDVVMLDPMLNLNNPTLSCYIGERLEVIEDNYDGDPSFIGVAWPEIELPADTRPPETGGWSVVRFIAAADLYATGELW